MPRLASGLAGGMGGTHRFTCGVLNGAAVIAGLLRGRDEPTDDPPPAYAMTGELISDFEKKFGTVLCHELVDIDPNVTYEQFRDQYRRKDTRVSVCSDLETFTVRRFYELLDEYEPS